MTAYDTPRSEVSTAVGVDHGTPAGRFSTTTGYVLGVLRIAMGWYFLWAFTDKTFGLGFATPTENAWIDGGSPTTGYLSGVEGPFADVYNGWAGNAFFDWVFMLGLLGVGLALILGIGMRIAAVAAVVMLVLMFGASLPLVTNPVIESHLTEAVTIVALALLGAGEYLGFGKAWARLPFVKNNRWLI